MKYHSILISLTLVLLGSSLATGKVSKPLEGSRPNIIFVLTDDQGMGDLSCMGNTILRTPNIDNLYKSSTRFTDFQV
ncbi:MAG: sulfatase-like hydrolase/transferase, partial [Verrucomicrobiia bacterium]